MRILAILLSIWLAIAPAVAGQMSLLGAGTPGAAAALPTLTYINTVTATVSNPTATVTGTSIGTAAADRHLVVIVNNTFSNIVNASMTVDSGGGAVAMTQQVLRGQNGASSGIYSLTVPTGTTATIVATQTGGSGWNNPRFHIYTITGLSSTTPTGANSSGATATSTSTTVATTSGGIIISGSSTQAATISNYTGSTETFTSNFGVGSNSQAAASATGVATNASSTVNVNGASSASIAVTAVAWR